VTDCAYVITVRGAAGPWVQAALDDVEVSAVGERTVLRRWNRPGGTGLRTRQTIEVIGHVPLGCTLDGADLSRSPARGPGRQQLST